MSETLDRSHVSFCLGYADESKVGDQTTRLRFIRGSATELREKE
ncbi:hypothetical protein UVI_02061290 [Ustilaginoidea virens]|uniref:Uncharacterized protein n=1 Tax=Ustilaginoidea virens TaxID=1159556 RepID=A0A1B5L8Q9_USTVR|nr:hypothetical protein UVI_02061290 [Ustilaginoidea virens]